MTSPSNKAFLLFMGGGYYPLGGAKDFVGVFKTLEDAKETIRLDWDEDDYDWAQIAVLEDNTLEIVYSRGWAFGWARKAEDYDDTPF